MTTLLLLALMFGSGPQAPGIRASWADRVEQTQAGVYQFRGHVRLELDANGVFASADEADYNAAKHQIDLRGHVVVGGLAPKETVMTATDLNGKVVDQAHATHFEMRTPAFVLSADEPGAAAGSELLFRGNVQITLLKPSGGK